MRRTLTVRAHERQFREFIRAYKRLKKTRLDGNHCHMPAPGTSAAKQMLNWVGAGADINIRQMKKCTRLPWWIDYLMLAVIWFPKRTMRIQFLSLCKAIMSCLGFIPQTNRSKKHPEGQLLCDRLDLLGWCSIPLLQIMPSTLSLGGLAILSHYLLRWRWLTI